MQLLRQRAATLRRHWEDMARTDALWAVLTDPTKQGGGWDEAEFYATGRATIAAHLALLPAPGPGCPPERALDFGCGVGRLTWALADHFPCVTGVDISAVMLDRARGHRTGDEAVEFVLNTTPDLRAWPDGTFDLVYSHLVLQHNPRPLMESFIGEFCRVCRPGGHVMFQLPARLALPRVRKPWWLWVWPPVLIRRTWRAFNRLAAVHGVMATNVLPVERVRELLAAAGMTNQREFEDVSAGPGHPGFLYLAQKPAGGAPPPGRGQTPDRPGPGDATQ